MDIDLNKKVVEDLKNSGFASGMEAVYSFLQNNWVCSGNSSYYDKDEEKIKTIDLYAFTHESLEKNDKKIFSTFYIAGEVEKSERPWVVSKGIPESLDRIGHLIYCEGPISQEIMDIAIMDSLLAKLGWRGHQIHESFKKSDKSSRWYPAFLAAVKGGEFLFNQEMPALEEMILDVENEAVSNNVVFQLLQPVVILDGTLLSAQIDESGNVEISEIDSAPMVFSYRSKDHKGVPFREPIERRCRIDLIRLDALPNYINACKKRQKAMMQEIYERLMRLER